MTNPREGWVRASTTAGPQVTAELVRLSDENARLRDEVATLTDREAVDEQAHAERTVALLAANSRDFGWRETKSSDWLISEPEGLDDLFDYLSPLLLADATLDRIASSLAMRFAGQDQTYWLAAVNQVRDFLTDLSALDVAQPSTKKRAVSDNEEYWTLTDHGRDVLRVIRSAVLVDNQESAAPPDPPPIKKPPPKATTKKAPAKKAPAKKAPAKKPPAKAPAKKG